MSSYPLKVVLKATGDQSPREIFLTLRLKLSFSTLRHAFSAAPRHTWMGETPKAAAIAGPAVRQPGYGSVDPLDGSSESGPENAPLDGAKHLGFMLSGFGGLAFTSLRFRWAGGPLQGLRHRPVYGSLAQLSTVKLVLTNSCFHKKHGGAMGEYNRRLVPC